MEIYKSIKGYEGYFISNLGNIKSVKENFKDKILKGRLTNCGYLRVALHKDNKQKDLSVHRLVADEFLDNKENKPQVNHKNSIKTDNRVENLEWSTRSENMIHSYKQGRTTKGRKIIRLGKEEKIYNKITEASIDNSINKANISQCLRGRSKTAGGYKWKYYD